MAVEFPTLSTHTRHEKDLGFAIVAEVKEYHVDFAIYNVLSWPKGEDGVPAYGTSYGEDETEDIAAAEPYLHGFVKWDGCSNWHFDAQDGCMLHACDKKGVQRFGDVMALCWEWASELCPQTICFDDYKR